jgi:hypothetical protein
MSTPQSDSIASQRRLSVRGLNVRSPPVLSGRRCRNLLGRALVWLGRPIAVATVQAQCSSPDLPTVREPKPNARGVESVAASESLQLVASFLLHWHEP